MKILTTVRMSEDLNLLFHLLKESYKTIYNFSISTARQGWLFWFWKYKLDIFYFNFYLHAWMHAYYVGWFISLVALM